MFDRGRIAYYYPNGYEQRLSLPHLTGMKLPVTGTEYIETLKISRQDKMIGVYSYPLRQAAEIAVQAVREFVKEHPDVLDEILWVLFDARTKAAYDEAPDALEEI